MGTTHDISKNLGGDRLGSGNKNNVTLHNYNRSNHDLSYAWRSTMNCGTLVPFMKLVGETGDTFSINLETIAKTIPTIGPLYGGFKLQLDVFECPLRLYNGLLHNNMTKIGMNMKQVKLPKIELTHYKKMGENNNGDFNTNVQMSTSSLMRYLGISGLGDNLSNSIYMTRKFNAVPLLAYWDIYKNYYSNKQEEIGAFIMPKKQITTTHVNWIQKADNYIYFTDTQMDSDVRDYQQKIKDIRADVPIDNHCSLNAAKYVISLNEEIEYPEEDIMLELYDSNDQFVGNEKLSAIFQYVNWAEAHWNNVTQTYDRYEIECFYPANEFTGYYARYVKYNGHTEYTGGLEIKTFDLQNIDNARIEILKNTGLGNELVLNQKIDWYPYKACWEIEDEHRIVFNEYAQNGLGLKTYQSDLLQNWLNTEWIDGENGINKITAVDTSSGSFEIDALNLANKVYNMWNRIAVSGGTYEDWQEAVFTANVNRRAETPVYKGGMACEIVFDEVVATASTSDTPLGSLAGHAITPDKGKRGGHIEITCTEPSYIMGIVSITPRIDYSQGNDWDMCELDTMDDLHKPALDGIGFEDLLQERAAWWGTYWDGTKWTKLAMGKTPAWLNYMTNINKAFGHFADNFSESGQMFMTLNRQYEYHEHGETGIADLTTYIDPRKFNYAFADTRLEAQNFWIQIGCEVHARRVMSAKILPNL